MSKISVVLTLEVPQGDHCWKLDNTHPACTHLSFVDGANRCDVNFHGQKETDAGVLKSPRCLALPLAEPETA